MIKPRTGILNPEGRTIQGALGNLGYDGVDHVRVGRLIDFDIEASDRQSAERTVREACERLLANPVIEDFEVELTESDLPSEVPG